MWRFHCKNVGCHCLEAVNSNCASLCYFLKVFGLYEG